MNMKTTKFLAVLAVFAMAFAGFAVVASGDNSDAAVSYNKTLGEFEISNSATPTEKFTLTIKGQSTLNADIGSKSSTVTGYTLNTKDDTAYGGAKYTGTSVLKMNIPALSSLTSIYGISVMQKNNAVAQLETTDMSTHQVLDKEAKTMTSWFAKSTFGSGDDFEFLIPQDGTGVELTVTIYGSDFNLNNKTGTAIGTASFALDLKGVTTVVDLSAAGNVQSLKGNVTGGWYYADDGDVLTLNAFTGNVAFEGKITTVSLVGTNKLVVNTPDSSSSSTKIIGTSINNSAIGSSQALTIKSSSTSAASLEINQKGTGTAICATNTLAIGSTSSTGVTTLTTTSGALGIYSGSSITIANSVVNATASEKAIRGYGAFSTTTSTITAKLSSTGVTNGVGQDDIWGIKVKGNMTNTSSVITTQGLRVGGSFTNTEAFPVYVTGDYQTNPDAGLHFDVSNAKVQLATASPGTSAVANTVYVQKDAAVFAPNSVITDVDNKAISAVAETADGIQELLADKTKNYKIVGFSTTADAKIAVGKEPIVGDSQKLEINASGASGKLSGTIYVGTTEKLPVTLTNVKGQFTISKGSIYIDGTLEGGTITLAGDAKINAVVDGAVTITSSLTTAPTLTVVNLAIEEGKSLALDNVSITTTKDIANAGDIILGKKAVFASQAKIVNTAAGEVYGYFNGSNVTLASSSGTITITDDITVNGKLTIPVGTTLAAGANDLTINEGGVVYVYGSITGTSVKNNGTIVVLDKDASIPANISGTGTIDTSAISSDYNISGEYRSAAAFGIYQNVNIVGDTNMVKGSLMIINGTMNIAAGVTLTIEDGAMLVINNSYGKLNNLGKIDDRSTITANTNTVIDSTTTFSVKLKELLGYGDETITSTFNAGFIIYNATVNNEGTIDLAWTTTGTEAKQTMLMLSNAIVNNEGMFNVSTLNTMTITDGSTFNNLEDGTFNMEGTVADLALNNAGLVKLDGIATGMITIHQVADEASVIVTSIKGTLKVDDVGLKYAYPIANGKNSITVTSTGYALSGLTFDSAVTYSSTKDEYYKNIYINGVVGIDSSATALIEFGATKYVKVTENLELPDEIAVTGTLSVSGTMVLEDGAKYTSAVLTVSGLVEAGKSQISGTVNATYFVTGTADKVYHYTTLSKAVDMAVLADINKLYIVGDNTVTSDVTIPSGMTVEQNGQLTIGSATKTGIILKVEDGAKINSTAAIIVKATLMIENKSTGITKSAAITSDIVVEDSTSIMYTNFVTAMGFEYDEPTTITLSNNVTVESNVTIPAFVTVDTNTKSFTVKGATLTIDGTLFLHNSDYAVTDVPGTVPKIGTVVVNGYIKSTNTTTYDGKAYPAGAYYTMVDKGAFNMITSIANSPNVIDIAEDKSIRIFGADIAFGDLAYEGTALAPAYISIEGTVSSGTVDLEYAQLSILADKEISFTVTGADGSIAFAGEKTAAKTVIYEGLDADGDEIFAMTAGSLVDGTAGSTHGVAIVGAVVLSDVSLNETTVIGVVAATSNVVFTGDLIVIGVFGVNNASKVTVAGDVFVMGSLIAAEVTETKAAGEMDITKDLYIGGDDEFDTSAAAVVTGDISAANYWVFADVTVEGKIADYLAAIVTKSYYTAFYVEEELFMTIYSTAASEIEIAKYNEQTGKVEYAFIPEELEECVFAAWMYEDDDGQYHPIVTKTSVKVGLYDAVYASIDYNIYSVQIVTDDGVKSVAINGIELVKTGNNVFTLSSAVGLVPLETGTYKVTYTLKNGYQEDKNGVTLYTNTGIVLKDHSFVASGATGYETIYLQLSGTEIIPEPEPVVPEKESEWTITTILLVVLVILIAIMAVIVALRLNRN